MKQQLNEPALRRSAIQLASQLPEGRENCLAVISHLTDLVAFIYSGEPPEAMNDKAKDTLDQG